MWSSGKNDNEEFHYSNNNPIVYESIEDQGLPADCRSHVHVPDRDELSSSQFTGDMWSSRWVVGFLDQDYCYKSVAIKIHHDIELEPILYTDRKFPSGDRTSAVSHSTKYDTN